MSVRLDVDGRRATIAIDRPDVLNALDREHEDRLEEAWRAIERDEGIHVVVLTGAGERAFCVGADMKSGDPDGLDYWAVPRPAGFGGISRRASLGIPVVARVNGHALGGGFEMVLGCDLAVAVEEATFGLPEALVGRVPLDGGIAHLAQALPPKRVSELLLTGRRIDAAEALALGLVNEVVPRERLDAAVDAVVERLLAAAPLSQRAIKEALRRGGEVDAATPALVRALRSEDAVEGVRAFQERRRPAWNGR